MYLDRHPLTCRRHSNVHLQHARVGEVRLRARARARIEPRVKVAHLAKAGCRHGSGVKGCKMAGTELIADNLIGHVAVKGWH